MKSRADKSKADIILETKDLKKTFVSGKKKKPVAAVRGVTMQVARGQVFGFLGPNGAGKTTTLRMLTTLLPIEEGEAWIAGFSVKDQPQEVRRRIGYVSQLGGADFMATGSENLLLQAQLYGFSRQQAASRAKHLVKMLDLADFVGRKVMTYSGGQRRRLDIAMGIIHKPDVLFLDEPTTGLDPQNRANLWDEVAKLRDQGTTVFLTTHYLDEADTLSDYVVIMDHGQIIAEGTPEQLKKQVAGDGVTIELDQTAKLPSVQAYLSKQPYVTGTQVEGEKLHVYAEDAAKILHRIFAALETHHVTAKTVTLSQPSLDDVFLHQTGRSLRDSDGGSPTNNAWSQS